MNDRDYTRKRQKVQRQKRFINSKRAASRQPIKKAARHRKELIKDDSNDYEDAPNGIQFRE